MNYIIFFTLALFATIMMLLIGGLIGNFFVKLYYSIDNALLKRELSVFGYHCFYLDNSSMKKDANCMRLIPILRELYIKDSSFNIYCSRLSEERLPIIVMINWARSVAEDLFAAPLPSVKLDQWNHFWKSKLYTRMTFWHSDFPKYEDYEMGCLWGAIYLWLVLCFDKDINDPLLQRIVQLACKEKTAVPYFYHLYNAARNINGNDFFLTSMPNVCGDIITEDGYNNPPKDSISAEDIYNGFASLSVSERCNARRLLNDLLADCSAWSVMRNEMKSRGWFKETIYPLGETNVTVNGDYVMNKNVENEVASVGTGGVGICKNMDDN